MYRSVLSVGPAKLGLKARSQLVLVSDNVADDHAGNVHDHSIREEK